MKRYTNQKLMEMNPVDEFWTKKVMPQINRHRIVHCRKVSKLGIPIVYKNGNKYVLDMYMYNHKSIKGKKYYRRNSMGEIVLPRMYRYFIDEETAKNFYCTESLGKKYNDAVKKAVQIAPGIKFDFMNNLDTAPTEKKIAKIAMEMI